MPEPGELVDDPEFATLPLEEQFRLIDVAIRETAPASPLDRDAEALVGLSASLKEKATDHHLSFLGADTAARTEAHKALKKQLDVFKWQDAQNPLDPDGDPLYSVRFKPDLRQPGNRFEVSLGDEKFELNAESDDDLAQGIRDFAVENSFKLSPEKTAGLSQALGNPDRTVAMDPLTSVMGAIGEFGRGIGGLTGIESLEKTGAQLAARNAPVRTDSTLRKVFQAATKEGFKLAAGGVATRGLSVGARINAIAALQTAPITGDVFQESFDHFREKGDENARSKALLEAGSRAAVMFGLERFVGGQIFGNGVVTKLTVAITPKIFGKLSPVVQKTVAGLVAEGGTEAIQEAADLIAQDMSRNQDKFKTEIDNIQRVLTSDAPLDTSQVLFAGTIGATVGTGAGAIVGSIDAVTQAAATKAIDEVLKQAEEARTAPQGTPLAPPAADPQGPAPVDGSGLESGEVAETTTEAGTGPQGVSGETQPERTRDAVVEETGEVGAVLPEPEVVETAETAETVSPAEEAQPDVAPQPQTIHEGGPETSTEVEPGPPLDRETGVVEPPTGAVKLKRGGRQKGFRNEVHAKAFRNRQENREGLEVVEKDGRFFVVEAGQVTPGPANQRPTPSDPVPASGSTPPLAAKTPEQQTQEVEQTAELDRPDNLPAGAADSSPETRNGFEQIASAQAELSGRTAQVVDLIFNQRKTAEEAAKEIGIPEDSAQALYAAGIAEIALSVGDAGKTVLFAREPQFTTSTMNEIMERERAERGEKSLLPGVVQTHPELIRLANNRIAGEPNYVDGLIEKLIGGSDQFGAVDEVVLLFEKVKTMNSRTSAFKRATDPAATQEARDSAMKEWEKLEERLGKIDQATFRSGQNWGRMGRFRQTLMRDDFSMEEMERRARLSKGADLEPHETEKIARQAEQIATLQAQLDEKYDEATERSRIAELEQELEALKKEAEEFQAKDKSAAFPPAVISVAEKITERISKAADAARERIRQRRSEGRLNMGLDPTILGDYAIIGVSHIVNGANTFAKWSAGMIGELGDTIQPHLSEIWEESQGMLQDNINDAPEADRPQVKRVVKSQSLEEQREILTERAKTKFTEAGNNLAAVRPVARKLALTFIQAGARGTQNIVDKVHAVLQEVDPSITKRQTSDLISGYGQFSPLSKEEDQRILRETSGELQQLSKIEDILSKRPPKKTGVERRTPNAEERRLIKEVNRLKRKYKIQVTDAATQLKTSEQAVETRLRNEIEDLEAAIAPPGSRLPEKGGTKITSEKIERLREIVKQRREEYAQLFPKEPETEAQRIARVEAALDRSIANLKDDIAHGRLSPAEKRKSATSPAIKAKKAELEALRAERDHMRAISVEFQLEAKRRKLEAKTRVAEKRLEDLRRRLREGDTSKRPRDTSTTLELEAMREESRALAKELKELADSRITQEEKDAIRLSAAKVRMTRKIAELQQRIIDKDFRVKEFVPIKLDKEGQDLAFLQNKIKKEFLNDRHKEQLAQRSFGKKILEETTHIATTSRAIMTSFDLSAPGRQGFLLAAAHPRLAQNALGEMFKTLVNNPIPENFRAGKNFRIGDQNFERINGDLLDHRVRPNAPLAKLAGLFIVDPNEHSLSKTEEAYQSRWAEAVPGIAASRRTYITFLNVLRMNAFDQMVEKVGRTGRGMDLERAKVLANFINISTGRGINAHLNGAGQALNLAFFSPRLLVSRFEYLFGLPIAAARASFGSDKEIQRFILSEYARTAASVAVPITLLMLAGADVEKDPRSSDFMKVRFGDTRIDFLAGLQQVSVMLSRSAPRDTDLFGLLDEPIEIGGGKKKTLSGKIVSLRGDDVPHGGDTGSIILGRFLRSKANPFTGTLIDFLDEKNVIGEKVSVDEPLTIAEKFMPMAASDAIEAFKEHDIPEATAFSMLAYFGFGVQTFEPRKRKKKVSRRIETGGR